ncbi:MAG: hypothetical protein U5O69_04205 [Candidatus Competibacteraceae bacterium]|nr:hypothetical protein [Candidatus Competibacteraceae bacterium]
MLAAVKTILARSGLDILEMSLPPTVPASTRVGNPMEYGIGWNLVENLGSWNKDYAVLIEVNLPIFCRRIFQPALKRPVGYRFWDRRAEFIRKPELTQKIREEIGKIFTMRKNKLLALQESLLQQAAARQPDKAPPLSPADLLIPREVAFDIKLSIDQLHQATVARL